MAEIVEREGWRVRLRDVVPAQEVEAAYRSLLSEYKKKVRVPGFRPGRVPDRVLEARLGRDALLAEVRESLIERRLPQAIKELGLDPVAVRKVEGEAALGQDFAFEAEIENYPEVELPDWKRFTIEVPEPEVSDEEVAAVLADLQRRYAEVSAKEGPAEEGDLVIVVTEEGSEIPIELARAFEAIKAALLGKAAGEAVEIPLLSEEGEPTGKTAQATVKEVKAIQLPALDDEFAKTLGYETLAEAREKIKEELLRRARAEAWEQKKDLLLERLAAELKAELPPSLVEAEERAIWGEIAEDLAKKGVPLEDYLKSLEPEKFEELKSDVKKSAERRVRRGLALEKLTEELGTKLEEDEWKAHLAELARAYNMKPAEFERALGEDALRRLYLRRLHAKALDQALKTLVA